MHLLVHIFLLMIGIVINQRKREPARPKDSKDLARKLMVLIYLIISEAFGSTSEHNFCYSHRMAPMLYWPEAIGPIL